MLKARMRSDATWKDVCIVNMSLHGLGIQTADPPARGAYVEVRRGPHVIVARIAWTKGHRAGLRAQDPIFISAVLRDEPAAVTSSPIPGRQVERRKTPRNTATLHDVSRQYGRAMEFACFGIIACALAFSTIGLVENALARPLEQIRLALK